jgi:hypothetical protein
MADESTLRLEEQGQEFLSSFLKLLDGATNLSL